jgi:cytochrome d ubiquinol oxidase subunit I
MGIGHHHAIQVARTQPAKLAAFEGVWETGSGVPLLLFGVPNAQTEKNDWAIGLPNGLSYMVGLSKDTRIQGLKDFPPAERPPLLPTFFSFHLMIYLGGWFALLGVTGLFLLWRGTCATNRLYLTAAALSLPLPFLANELGWMAAEIGRQPWVVYNLMRTRDAVSAAVPAGQILASIILFSLIYTLLFGVWLYLLKRQIDKGPQPLEKEVRP